MALSADDRKHYWKEQKESLNRIRSRLSDRDTPPNRRSSPQQAGYRRSHSPYGKYRKPSSPAYLPGLDRESPDHRYDRQRKELRGKNYDIVPPVRHSIRHRGTNRSPSVDYDSWGEESDEEDDDRDDNKRPQMYMPFPYSDPCFGYPSTYNMPNGQPPMVTYAPMPVFYPPPPQQYGKRRRKGRQQQRSPDRLEVHRSQPDVRRSQPDNREPSKKGYNVHYSLPQKLDRYEPSPVREEILQRYKYIQPRDTPYSPYKPTETHNDQRFGGDVLMYLHFNHQPLFAESLVDGLINDFLDEIIPDFLIDILTPSKMTPGHPLYYPSQDAAEELLSDVIDEMLEDTSKRAIADMVNEYMGKKKGSDMDWLKQLEQEKAATDVFEDLMMEVIDEIRPTIVDETYTDILIDELVEEDVIDPEIDDEIVTVAHEILNKFDTKIMRRELKAVSKVANDKLVDMFMEQYLLTLIARQGKVWGENDHANKAMDSLILNILIEQYYQVRDDREKTITNTPVRKLHEKVVTDVALDLLLQQLSITLDEDMLDVDEYERGVDGYTSQPVTPTLPISRVYR